MKVSRRIAGIVACALIVSIAPAFPRRTAALTLDPAVDRARVMMAEIYDVTAWALRIPYDLAFPLIVRAKLEDYLARLPLDEALRARVTARIRSAEFVDEMVPFLIAVKEMYVASDATGEDFDAHLRASYSRAEGIPGFEHSMFSWKPDGDSPETGSGLGLNDRIAAKLVALYDALYERGASGREGLAARLDCRSDRVRADLLAVVERAKPVVRSLLAEVLEQLEPEGDIALAVSGVLRDDDRLEAATVSLVRFTDDMVCKHYRIFATRVRREQQLREWMRGELDKPGGGRLWEFLEHADDGRRYAMLMVVDGLEGELLRSLASPESDSPFLREAWREHQRAASFAPSTQFSRPAPPQQTAFLEQRVTNGFDDPRYLPFFRSLYRNARSPATAAHYAIADVGIAGTPTISVRNLPIAETGAPVAGPGATGIPNFHFVDRNRTRDGEPEGRAYYFFGSDALLLPELTHEAGMKSLFERLPLLDTFNCAAQYDGAAHYSVDALVNLAIGEKRRDFGEIICNAEMNKRAANEIRLRGLRAELLARRETLTRRFRWYQLYRRSGQRDARALAQRSIDEIAALEQETIPELLVYYYPWPDHFSHFTGPFADEIVAPSGELARLDYWLGRLSKIYERARVDSRTLFALSGDHGLAPVFHLLNPEVEVFDRLRERGIDFRVVKISSDEGEGPKLTNPLNPPSMRGIDVVVASTAGGNYMLDLFKDQHGRWREQPLYGDLLAVAPLPREGRAGVEPLDLVQEIFTRLSESLDYMVLRETHCGPESATVRAIGPRAGKRVDALIIRRGDKIYYRSGKADLLGTDVLTPYETLRADQIATHRRLRARCVDEAREEAPETWCSEDQWRLMTSFTARPDSVAQLAHVYDSDRAGTINLFPAQGIGYNSIVPGRHAGESFHEKNAYVGLWGAPVRRDPGSQALRSVVIGSVPTAVYEYLTGTRVTPGSDGWGYRSLSADIFPDTAQ